VKKPNECLRPANLKARFLKIGLKTVFFCCTVLISGYLNSDVTPFCDGLCIKMCAIELF